MSFDMDEIDQLVREGKLTQFDGDCIKERGRKLTGRFAHYCYDWDGMTVDETCVEAESCHDCDYDDAAKAEIAQAVADMQKAEAEFFAQAGISLSH